jgi:hypothetical protein
MTKRRQKPAIKPTPTFATEGAERAFWDSADSTDYVDWGRAGRIRLPELKPSSATISLHS